MCTSRRKFTALRRIGACVCLSGLLLLAGCASTSGDPVASAWVPEDGWWQEAAVNGGHLEAPDGSARFLRPLHAKNLYEVSKAIGRHAPIAASLALVGNESPNAYASVVGGRPVIAVSLSFLELLGEDRDALATTLGHEIAHIHFGHGAIRKERLLATQGASQILGTLLGLAGVPLGGTLANVGVTAVARLFTRDEERAADAKGLDWATAAGFSACGSVRTMLALQAAGGGRGIPFLATHPGDEERIERANEVALRLTGKVCY